MVKAPEEGATALEARTGPTQLWVPLLPACHNQLGQEWVLHLIASHRKEWSPTPFTTGESITGPESNIKKSFVFFTMTLLEIKQAENKLLSSYAVS